MNISDVGNVSPYIRAVVKELDEVELNYWREDHTKYTVIDPIIRGPGVEHHLSEGGPSRASPPLSGGQGRLRSPRRCRRGGSSWS